MSRWIRRAAAVAATVVVGWYALVRLIDWIGATPTDEDFA